MMNRQIILSAVMLLTASVAWAQQTDDRTRQLEIENKMLKVQVDALKTKLKADQPVQQSEAGGDATTQPTTSPAAQSGPTRITRTFAIHETNSAWLRDADVFLFEMALRDLVKDRLPREAPEEWLGRKKFFVGEQVNWEMQIDSVKSVTPGQAGKDYYQSVEDIEQQKERIAELKGNGRPKTTGNDRARRNRNSRSSRSSRSSRNSRSSRSTRNRTRDIRDDMPAPPDMDGMPGWRTSGRNSIKDKKEQIAEAEQELMELEARSRQLQKLMASKEAAMLTASYSAAAAPGDSPSGGYAPRGGRARSGRASQAGLEVTVALSDQDTSRIEKYQETKADRYTSRGGWPIRITGKVESLSYDGRTVYLIIDGTWRNAPGGGEGSMLKTRDDRNTPARRRSTRRRSSR